MDTMVASDGAITIKGPFQIRMDLPGDTDPRRDPPTDHERRVHRPKKARGAR